MLPNVIYVPIITLWLSGWKQIISFFRVNADEMGLVCAVAVMGNPMAITNPAISDDGMALKRLQQVFAKEEKYSVSEISKDAFVASAEDLNKADLTTGQIPLVSAMPRH